MPPLRTAAIILLLLAIPASAQTAATPLPDAIAAPGETVVLTAHAVGAQVYECKPGADGKLVWTFQEPVASLTVDGKVIGRHYAGPRWEHIDGSVIGGKSAGSAPGASPNDIPWLRLNVISQQGSGILSGVTTVQRINTLGGKLEGECDRADSSRSMPYAADYVFLRKG